MTEDRKNILLQYRNHRVTVEQSLFQVIQKLSSKENITATDASALAAVTEALVSLQKMGSY